MLDCRASLGAAPEPRWVQGRIEGVAGRGEPPAVQGAKNLNSCSPLSRRDKLRRDDKHTIQSSIPPLGVSVFG